MRSCGWAWPKWHDQTDVAANGEAERVESENAFQTGGPFGET